MTVAGDLWPGTSRFEVKRRLGSGGMGAVYEAYDREHRVWVALKTLESADARARARFEREFLALQGLEHPNLIRLGELIEDAERWFFTMELIDGRDFVSHVRAQVRAGDDLDHQAVAFDEPKLRSALVQLAQALAVVHRAGKQHRDIKPSNILVTEAGRVVLLDFGLVAEATGGHQSCEPVAVGTAQYVAPEQALGRGAGPASDWYSFGVVLYEALTGRTPQGGATEFELLRNKQERVPAPPRQRVPDVPRDLDQLCVELIRIDPERRPAAREILQRLGAHQDDSSSAQAEGFALPAPAQAPSFVGRARELSILHQAADDHRRGALVSVLIEGESGLGKTELVREFTRTLVARSRQALVLCGRCHERSAEPYEAFAGIADSLGHFMATLPEADAAALLPRRAGLLPELFPVLARVRAIAAAPLESRAGLDPQEQRSRLFGAFRELLARVAGARRVVLVIEDLHWIGADSLTMLGELLHPASRPEVLLLGAARPGVQDVLTKQLSGELRHLPLTELSGGDAAELVARLAPGLDTGQARAIVESAAGHPLFILELVRYLAEGGTASEISLDDALWSRISLLAPGHSKLLEVLSVADAPIAREIAASAAGLGHADFAKALQHLRTASLVRIAGRDANAIEPYHDRIRGALLTQMDRAHRVRCHLELANAIEQSGLVTTDPQLLVRHFAAAGEGQRAAKHAETAAARAFSISAFDRAAELFTTALELGSPEPAKARSLRLVLGQTLVAAGRGLAAAEIFLVAANGADASTRLDCHRQAAEQLLISGHLDRGLDAMNTLLAEVGARMPPSPRRALISLMWHRSKLRVRGLRWKEREPSQIAPEELVRLDVYEAASHGLGLTDVIRGMDFQARGLLLALRTGERSRVARALFYESVFLSSGGPRLAARARALLEEATRIAAPLQDSYLDAWKATGTGFIHYFGGRYRLAVADFSVAEKLYREHGSTAWEVSSVRMVWMWTLHRLGALTEMSSRLRGYLRDAERRGDLYAQTSLIRSCHRGLLVTGSIEAVRSELSRTRWVPAEGHYHLQHWYEFYARAEVALYAGDSLEMAAEIRENERGIARSMLFQLQIVRVDFHWLRARLLLAACEQETSPSPTLRKVRRLVRKLESERFGVAQVMASLLRAGIQFQENQPERACSSLRSLVEFAAQQGLSLHGAAAEYRLGQLLRGEQGAGLLGRASERMKAKGIGQAAPMVQLLAPGFS